MEIQQIESFVQVAKEMNFSRAANKMYISQSTISARIKNLETILGVPLFFRSGKEIRLTPFGELYLPYAEKSLEILAEGKKVIEEKRSYKIKIRIGVTNPFSTYVLPFVLPDFYHQFPDIDIHVISVTHSIDILKMVQDSQIDIGFVNTTEMLDHTSVNFLRYTTLYRSPLVLVTNPKHPQLENLSTSINDMISEQKFIFLSSKTSISKLVQKYFETYGIKPASSIEINSVTAAKEIMKMAPVLTLLPKLIVSKEIESGELSELPLPHPPSLVTSVVCNPYYQASEILHFIKQKVDNYINQSKPASLA